MRLRLQQDGIVIAGAVTGEYSATRISASSLSDCFARFSLRALLRRRCLYESALPKLRCSPLVSRCLPVVLVCVEDDDACAAALAMVAIRIRLSPWHSVMSTQRYHAVSHSHYAAFFIRECPLPAERRVTSVKRLNVTIASHCVPALRHHAARFSGALRSWKVTTRQSRCVLKLEAHSSSSDSTA